MKTRYLKVSGDFVYGKNEITRNDLVDKAQGRIDVLIDTEEGKVFNSDENLWEDIKGE